MGYSLLGNNIQGVLTAGINNAVTAMNVTLDAGSKSYPAGIAAATPIHLTLSDPDNPLLNEIVKVTAATGANVTTMVRAQRGTTALTWAADTKVTLNLHAQDITERSDNAILAAGTAAAPSLIWGDPATGFYRSAENNIDATINGTNRLQLSSTGLLITTASIIVKNVESSAQIRATSYREASTQSSVRLDCSRGTETTPANLRTNDGLGAIQCYAWTSGTTLTYAAQLRFMAAENHSATATGSKFELSICPNGTTTPVAALTVGNDKAFVALGSAKVTTGFAAWNTTPPASQPAVPSGTDSAKITAIIAVLVGAGLCAAA